MENVLHSSSLHKVRLYGTLFKAKLLTEEASFLNQIKSRLNNHWEWMKAIQKMKLSKFLRPPSQDFTDESSPLHRYPRIIQVKDQRIISGHWLLLYLHQPWTMCQMGKISNLGRSYQNYPMLAAMQSFPNWLLELPVFFHVKERLLDCNFRTQLLKIFSSIY